LVAKGILHRDDAIRAAEIGVDGESNHGGRQLDQARAPLEVLPVRGPGVCACDFLTTEPFIPCD
jgi:isopentenyl diphosphate isomerase/L-lactate dehydrogenase-like FMN-dependent dehydrogenase